MRRLAVIVMAVAAMPAEAWPGRDAEARAEFRRANPCPATGRVSGACRGWEVDHVTPLKCGGTDTPDNMQWLTVEQHKAKTKTEAGLCRRPRRPAMAASTPP